MSPHGRPTVHDLCSLSLHPTGARAKQKETNVVQDARGNLIAKDATGWSRVVRRRRTEEEEEEEEDSEEMIAKGKGNEMYVNQPKGARARKRRRLVHDVDFLQGRENDRNTTEFPTPSADLLKQIHHFTSHYFAAHNLLLDSAREHRKARKAKRDEKKAEAMRREQGHEMEEKENTDIKGEIDSEDEAEAVEGGEESDDAEGMGESKSQSKRRKRGEKKTLRRDMYKIFDGSALMALGMLLQHYTAALLTPTVREGWEEEMEKYNNGIGVDAFGDEEKTKGSKKKYRGGDGRTGKHAHARESLL